jgi:hypothetical protein
MIVKIAAFGHVAQKSQQQPGLLADALKIQRRALFEALRNGASAEDENQKTAARNGTPD